MLIELETEINEIERTVEFIRRYLWPSRYGKKNYSF